MQKIKLLILNNLKFIALAQLLMIAALFSMLSERAEELSACQKISGVLSSQILLYRLPKTN